MRATVQNPYEDSASPSYRKSLVNGTDNGFSYRSYVSNSGCSMLLGLCSASSRFAQETIEPKYCVRSIQQFQSHGYANICGSLYSGLQMPRNTSVLCDGCNNARRAFRTGRNFGQTQENTTLENVVLALHIISPQQALQSLINSL